MGDSDEEFNFCGTLEDYTNIFKNCQSQIGSGNQHVADKVEDKKKTSIKSEVKVEKLKSPSKKKSGKKSRSKRSKARASKSTTSKSKDVEELSIDTRNVVDEFLEFMKTSNARAGTSRSKEMEIERLESPIVLIENVETNTELDILENNNTPVKINNYLNVRVRWKGIVHKFRMIESDKVLKLQRLMGKTFDVQPDEILIFLNDEDEPLDSSKTLKESNVTIGLVLDAIKIVSKVPRTTQPKRNVLKKDLSMIRLKFQGKMSKNDEVSMYLKKTSSFEEIQKLYAEKKNLRADQVMFRFDGDIVDLEDTPESLDLEEDDCFDVVLSN